MNSSLYIVIAAAVVVVFNVFVSVAVFRDVGTTPYQKIVKLLVIWLFPIFGGVLMLVLVASHYTRDEMKSLVPFPFYMASVSKKRSEKVEDNLGDLWGVCGGGYGEGSCGGD